ncbi:hypothetical protein VCHA53O466_50313 [Vibrio chagasii]|nr:hypothetical protein VCHA53O466_50313 [Vibrio chagasii]
MKVRICKKQYKIAAKQLASDIGVKKRIAFDYIAHGLGFVGYSEYCQCVSVEPHTSFFSKGKMRDVEQLSMVELKDLELRFSNVLQDFNYYIFKPIRSFRFIDDVKIQKLGHYKSKSGGYKVRAFLGMFPYLMEYQTTKLGGVPDVHPNQLIDYYCESVIKRYYKGDELARALIQRTHELQGIPVAELDVIERKHLMELFAYTQHPSSKIYAETLIVNYIVDDMSKCGDGSGLRDFLLSLIADSDIRNPFSSGLDDDSCMSEQLLPDLTIRRVYGDDHREKLFGIPLRDNSNQRHNLLFRPITGLDHKKPLLISEMTSKGKAIYLSDDDLRSGLIVRGTTGSGSFETIELMMSQMMSFGAGMVYFDFSGNLGSASKMYSFASVFGRERSFMIITRSMMDRITTEDIKSYIAENRIIYVHIGTIMKMIDGVSGEVCRFMDKWTEAIRCIELTVVDETFTLLANDDVYWDPCLTDSFNSLDSAASQSGLGRILCDYGESYYRHISGKLDYRCHLLMLAYSQPECPHFAKRERLTAGEFLFTLDDNLVNDVVRHIPYRSVEFMNEIFINQ